MCEFSAFWCDIAQSSVSNLHVSRLSPHIASCNSALEKGHYTCQCCTISCDESYTWCVEKDMQLTAELAVFQFP